MQGLSIVILSFLSPFQSLLSALALALYLCAIIITPPAQAEIPVRNYNPFALMVGVPEMTSAYLLSDGQSEVAFKSTISNQWNISSAGDETVFVDGEVQVTDLNIRYGLSRMDIAVNVPWIQYQEGRLDPLIEDFHATFDMPNGGREYFYQDQLLFVYENEGTQQSLRVDDKVSGVGDVRVTVVGQLSLSDAFASSLGAQLKLANADKDKWLGSGSYDLAIYSSNEWLTGIWQTQLQFGALFMQDKGFLEGQREEVAGFAGFAINANMFANMWWSLQYDFHTRLFKESGIAPLSEGQMVSMAFAWRGKAWGTHLAIIEDVAVESAPDVGFQLGLDIRL